MTIKTEVTLQPDYTRCLRVMGKNPALQKLLSYHFRSVPGGRRLQKYSNLVVLFVCPQGGVTNPMQMITNPKTPH